MKRVFVILVLGLLSVAPVPAQAPPPAAADFTALARAAVEELSSKSFDKFIARLDLTVGAVLTGPKLAVLWDQITTQSGAFKSITSVRLEEAQGAHVGTVTCVFEKQSLGLRVAFNNDQKIVGFFIVPPDPSPTARRPQEPSRPFPYREEEVGYENAAARIRLAATLTIPQGNGPFPGVLLITGSGAQDRDEALMGHRPFLVLSDYLTRRGIAVLRADDRGVGKSGGGFLSATSADFAADAEAGLAFLRTRSEVDRKRIGLAGHSEGGMIAAMIAAKDADLAFLVMMAASGVPGHEIVTEQVRLMAVAGGMTADQAREAAAKQRELLAAVMADTGSGDLAAKLRPMFPPQTSDAAVETALRQVTSPWYRYFLAYDPSTALRQVKCRVLVLDGAKDVQVPPAQNLPAIRRALEAGGNTHAEVIEWPDVNHLFQTARTGSPVEYSQIEETIAEGVLAKIASWIVQ